MKHSHYEVLGLAEEASQSEIAAAFRKLAKIYHPDLQGGNTERFKKINEAHSILKDPYKRGLYNYELKLRHAHSDQNASSVGKSLNVVVSVVLVVLGIYLWGLGDRKGTEYNGWFVLLGWLSVLYGIGLFSRRDFKFSNPFTVVKVVFNFVMLSAIRLTIRLSLAGAVLFGIVVLLAIVSWLNSHIFHILPDSF